MKKFLAGLVLLALCISTSIASAQSWRTVQLPIRTSLAAASGGYVDSFTASIGGAVNTVDTTGSFAPKYPSILADSVAFIIVGLGFNAALASGESLYVGLEGSADNGRSWRTINPGAISWQGIKSGANVSAQAQNGVVAFNAAAVGTTNVTGASTVAGSIYGDWRNWPLLRVKVRQDAATIEVANSYSVWVTFPQ